MAIPIIPMVVATALFMENTDSTILATALPTIAADLRIDPISLKLAVTSYLVSLAVFIPASGWVADRVGARTTFRIALIVFMAASIGCAFSRSLGQFVVFRALQGVGGAMMVPVGRMVVIRAVPKNELVRALSFISMPALIGPMLGPPLDLRGFLLSALGLGGVILGTAMVGRRIAPPETVAACILIGAISLAGYAVHALRVERPLLDLRLLRFATFEAGIVGGTFFRFGVGASAFLLPLMLQLGFGLDALRSGLITFSGAVGALAVKPLARVFLRRFGFRRLLIVNGLLASLVLMAYALFTAATPHGVLFIVLLCGGFLRSLQFTSLSALTYADLESRQIGAATAMASVAQQVSVSLGVATGAMVLEISELIAQHARPQTADFAAAFVVVGVVSLGSALLLLRLPGTAGDEISGRIVPRGGELVSRKPA